MVHKLLPAYVRLVTYSMEKDDNDDAIVKNIKTLWNDVLINKIYKSIGMNNLIGTIMTIQYREYAFNDYLRM